MEKYNIESEEKLISLFGYTIKGPDNSNRWLIFDENNNNVGFIQYKKIVRKNNKKGLVPIYGYQMEIDSSIIKYKSVRKLNNRNENLFYDSKFVYEFDIKREHGNSDHISIDMRENPNLTLWSEKYGFINFKINYETLYVNFKSKTENFNIEETIIVKLSDTTKFYDYCLNYSDINQDIDSKDVNFLSIEFKTLENYCDDKERLKISQKKWKNGDFISEYSSVVDGNFEEAILKHQMGIESFKHFRFLINKVLPFKQELISKMLEIRGLEESEFILFMPDLNPDDSQLNLEEQNLKIIKK